MTERLVRHSGKLALAVMASGVILYNVTEYLSPTTADASRVGGSTSTNGLQQRNGNSTTTQQPVMTLEQARVRAMIENAQQSTWQQNLDNALVAQEKFMLGNERGEKSPAFIKKIEARSHELMQEAEKQRQIDLEKERKRKITTKIW